MEFNLDEMSVEELDALLAAIQVKLEELAGEGEEREEDEEGEAPAEELPAEVAEIVEGLSDDLDQLEQLIDQVEGRKAEISRKAEKRAALISKIAKRDSGKVVRTFEEKTQEEKKMFEVGSKEYRNAWLKKLQGKELDAQERDAMTASAAIPTQTMNEIVGKLELNPLIAAVDVTHFPNNVTYPAESSVAEASWVAMGSASVDSADAIAAVTLSAYKLIKTVSITADVKAMSVDAFEQWLVARLANKIEKAIDNGILNGGGSTSGECLGIIATKGTPDGTYTAAAMKWKDLTKIMGDLPGQYHPNATFVMPPALFFGEVLGMVDSQNNRVVVNDPQEPRKYNVLGYPVIVDGNAGTDEVYFGDLKAYKFNFAADIEVTSSDETDFRYGNRVWRAMTLADGKLADPKAIVRYIRAT
jgi:HK97 family phage major capsid protein